MEAARARDFDVKINSHGNFIDDALADRLAAMACTASRCRSTPTRRPTTRR
ncbi:MAG: hypothetical protein R3F43_17385 [bacterium]